MRKQSRSKTDDKKGTVRGKGRVPRVVPLRKTKQTVLRFVLNGNYMWVENWNGDVVVPAFSTTSHQEIEDGIGTLRFVLTNFLIYGASKPGASK